MHGLGPIFKLVMELQNTSADQPSMNLFLTFHCDIQIYKITRNYICVPYLTPGFVYSFSTKVECISELNVSDLIKVPGNTSVKLVYQIYKIIILIIIKKINFYQQVYVVREGEMIPIITAVINMPASEAPV